jgi:hypothetical protein
MTLNTRTKFLNAVDLVLRKALVVAPIGAEDMNAGQGIVQHPEKHYGTTEDSTLHKDFIEQGYNPAYGTVGVLFKADGPNADYTDHEFIVAGYASPQVIDRERHVILKEAMEKDLPRFLANPLYANAQILHSNVQVGQVLPEWKHPETGKVYKTQVDNIGLFCVIRVRTDKYRPKIVDKVIDDILANKLKSFSISGDAPVESRQHVCKDGECFWIIPEIEFYEFTLCEEGVNQDAKMVVLNKACSDGMCGVTQGAKAMAKRWFGEKEESTEQLESADTVPNEVRERANEVASHIGEDSAVQMVNDAQDAARKLENVGMGSGADGDANTMSDFAQPYTSETAKAYDPDVKELANQYIKFAHNGGSPEDVYFKMLQDGAPSWFGTKSDNFRQFLVQIYRAKAPVPSIKLRIAGTQMGQMVKDPSNMTAFDLLQTALGNPGGSGGDIQKDVSPLWHEHEADSGERSTQAVQPRGLVDERGIGETGAPREPEESEEYYLNLALKALPSRKLDDHKGPGIKPHPHGRKRGYRSGKRFRGTAPQAEENPMHTHAELGGLKHRHPRGDAPHTHTEDGGILFKAAKSQWGTHIFAPEHGGSSARHEHEHKHRGGSHSHRHSHNANEKLSHSHYHKIGSPGKPQIAPPPHNSASASIYPRPKHDLEVVRNAVASGKKAPVKPKAQPKVTFKPVAPEPDMDAPAQAGDPLKPDIGQKAGGQGKIQVPAPGRRRNFMKVVKSIQDKPISQQNDFPSDKGTTFVQSGGRVNNRATSEIISPTKQTEGLDGKSLDTVLQPPPGVTAVRPEAGMQGKNVGSDAKQIQVVNQGVALNPQADLDERGAVKGSGSVS